MVTHRTMVFPKHARSVRFGRLATQWPTGNHDNEFVRNGFQGDISIHVRNAGEFSCRRNCSGHLRTLFLESRNDARSHIGAVVARMIETTKTVDFMTGSENWGRK